ncbi:hypothetical protein P9112_010029 [Eukaryota sp. TZLM1-RC]
MAEVKKLMDQNSSCEIVLQLSSHLARTQKIYFSAKVYVKTVEYEETHSFCKNHHFLKFWFPEFDFLSPEKKVADETAASVSGGNIVNSNHTPYQVIFGSDVSPRSDPGKILEIIESSTSESSFIQEIQSKFRRLKEKQEKAAHHQASKASKLTRSATPNPFEVGQLVLRASSSSAKLHGDYLGPFLITEIVSNSSANIKNLCTGTIVQASVKHLAPWHSSLPTNDEFHSWVAAGDVEEHIIERVLSQEGDFCQVQWPGKEITTEHVSTVQNTAAYKDFIKTSKARRRTKSAPPKKRTNSISSPPVTRASRARRSKERKRQC